MIHSIDENGIIDGGDDNNDDHIITNLTATLMKERIHKLFLTSCELHILSIPPHLSPLHCRTVRSQFLEQHFPTSPPLKLVNEGWKHAL